MRKPSLTVSGLKRDTRETAVAAAAAVLLGLGACCHLCWRDTLSVPRPRCHAGCKNGSWPSSHGGHGLSPRQAVQQEDARGTALQRPGGRGLSKNLAPSPGSAHRDWRRRWGPVPRGHSPKPRRRPRPAVPLQRGEQRGWACTGSTRSAAATTAPEIPNYPSAGSREETF